MTRMIFVNIPVADIPRYRRFATALGFTINEQFSDENAISVVISDTITVMALTREYFGTFVTKPVADGSTAGLTIALSAESREEVDELVAKALEAGGSPAAAKQDQMDGMYGWSFLDPDGHQWELVWMSPEFAG